MITSQKGRIFISYRRADSAGYAGRIYDRLSVHFGEEAIFMDVTTIDAGLDFVAVLQDAVQSCDVLVALIGRSWLNIKDEAGKRRLENPEDFVRVEIAAALNRDIRVIPVLVDGASMPRSTELPDNLKPLARRNALQVNHPSFNEDAYRLIAQLELALKAAEDSKILKAQALKEERARAQRQAEIERLLKSADLAINLKDWKLAQEKLNDVLKLNASHLDARSKLDIVHRKISELEKEKEIAENAAGEREERERKEREEKTRIEKEERARLAAAQKAQKEREEREQKASKEKAKKEKEELERKILPAAPVSRTVTPTYPSETEKPARKPAWLPYGIGGGVLLACAIIFGIGYLIQNALTPDSPTATNRPQLQATETDTPQPPEPVVTEQSATSPANAPPANPSIGSTWVQTKDGMAMVYVPAGEFQMGSDADEALAECQKFRTDCQRDWFTDEEPIHTVDLDAFWIDQTEVTNEMFAKFIDNSGYETEAQKAGNSYIYKDGSWQKVSGADWQHPSGPDSDISDIMDHPVVHVSWNDAVAYCEWADRRLPTEAEWEKSSGWDEDAQVQKMYPWGNVFDGTKANFCDTNCSFDWKNSEYDDNYTDTAPVGSYPAGVSFYGAYDMAGNVWEWVADWYDGDYYANSSSSNPKGPDSGSFRVLRGGSWSDGVDALRSADRYGGGPTSAYYGFGFRCSRSP